MLNSCLYFSKNSMSLIKSETYDMTSSGELKQVFTSENNQTTPNNIIKKYKNKSVHFIETPEMFDKEFFTKMSKKQLEMYKYNWGSFCRQSYYDQKNPPTEDMYVDFFRKKLLKGSSKAGLHSIYYPVKKVAQVVFGQNIHTFEKVKELLPQLTHKPHNPQDPKMPKPGSSIDDSGVCPQCGDVSISTLF